MKENKKKVILIVLALLSIVAITIGITYAFFNYAKEGTTDNTITSGTIEFLYTENPIAGRGIALVDAMPMSDSDGIRLSGEGNEFNFTITSKTPSKIAIPYEITARRELEVNNSDNLDPSVVRIYLAKVETGLEDQEVLLENFNKLKTPTKEGIDTTTERLLYTGKVPSEQQNYEQQFKLKMWIDGKADFSPETNEDGSYKTDEDGNLIYPYNNKKFTIKVNVYSYGDVLTQEQATNENKAEIKNIYLGNKEDDVKFEEVTGEDYQYETILPEGTTETTIEIDTIDENAEVIIEKLDSLALNTVLTIEKMSTKRTLFLDPGDNYFKITIRSLKDKEIKSEYKINIKVQRIIPLVDAIKENYPTAINLKQTNSNAFNSKYKESGLFLETYTGKDENDNDINKESYYFRGEVDNNWVSFAGYKWRIVRINEDGAVRIIMQDGINSNKGYAFNSDKTYLNSYYSKSTTKSLMDNWYTNNIDKLGYSNVVTIGYYCQATKAKNINQATAATTVLFSNYTPSFSCNNDSEGYGILPSNIGLLNYDELIFAGGYMDSNVNNFYLYNGWSWWTMSQGGYYGSGGAGIWSSHNGKIVVTAGSNAKFPMRPVINLKADTTITKGNGTSTDPFLITGSPEV